MTGIFQKLKSFFIGVDPIEVYGGNKGGYSYIIFFDPKNKQILHQFITPPKQQSKNIAFGAEAVGHALTGSINYQSEETYGETFAVSNKDATLDLKAVEILGKYNEAQGATGPKLAQPKITHDLSGENNILAGIYMMPVTTNDVICPTIVAHFPIENQRIEYILQMFPQLIIKTFYPQDNSVRCAIFLHNAIKKELKMRASYNMEGYIDYNLALSDSAGAVGMAYTKKKIHIWDGEVLTHEERGVESSQVWDGMKSILAVPIFDNDNIPLGTISIDSSKSYVDASFKSGTINNSIMLLGRSIGRILERV